MRSLFLIFLLVSNLIFSQIVKPNNKVTEVDQDTLVVNSGKNDSLKIFNPTISDYRFQTQFSEKKVFDTLLTHDKSYSFSQYTNHDNFGAIQYANIGSGYNSLTYNWNGQYDLSLMPTNKSYGIVAADQVKYYDVKTPTTAFVFHNGISNGASLYSTYTQNIGKRFNFAIDYFGLRSQGAYQKSLAVNNNTTISTHYISKNNRYELFGHFIHQNITNQENGGITNEYDLLYQAGNSEISNRQTIPVNFSDSYSRFAYRRYYLSHQLALFDIARFPFKINHTFSNQSNKYYYEMSSADLSLFSDAIDHKNNSSKKFSDNLSNSISLLYDAEKFKLDAGIRHQLIRLGTNNEVLLGNPMLPEYRENRLGLVGNLKYKFSDVFSLASKLELSKGSVFGNYILSQNSLFIQPIKDYTLHAFANFKSSAPGFNYLVNSSPVLSYNFQMPFFQNENALSFGGELGMKFWQTKFFAKYHRIENYTYLNRFYQPEQSSEAVGIAQLGGETTMNYGRFFLNTRLQFQQNSSGKDMLPLPNFLGRANFFYQSRAFKDKAEIQTGIKVYYFSKFNSREFYPILNEYALPGLTSFAIGGQPIVDAYFNFKVKKMFFFIEGQHLTTLISPNKVYAAPHYPFYDFRLNLGIVWYLFS